MSILPRETGGGIFGQGAFQVDPNATPDQIAMKRQLMAAMMPRYGEAKYIGQGLGQLATGLAHGRLNRNLDKAEGAGRKSAAERFQQLLGGGTAQPGGFSILGAAPQPEPNSPQGIANDTMAALGKGPDFAALEQQYGLPQGYLQRTAQIESGGNPNAQNPNSSAGGMFQFIDSTAKQYGLENKFDPMASADAAARLARDNLGYLKQALGREPTAGELYLAHQQGAGGAAKLLAAGNAPAASVVGADAAGLNGGGGMSAADFAGKWTGKFGGQQPQQPQGAPLEALYAAAADPWLDQGQRAVIMQMIQQRQQDSDPMRQMQLQKGQLELEQLRNPQAPEELTTRRALAAEAGLQPGTPEYRSYMATGKLAGGADLPSGFATLDLQAKAAGYQPGTPEYQEFMRNGGGSGAPAAFIALDLQAKAAGFTPGTPEYQQFMATRGSGLAAQATAQGKAAGEATASAPTQIANGEIALQGIEEIRNHPSIDWGTGASSVFNRIPGTGGYAFESRVQQLAGGAFLTAIQQMQGMGALSNAEGQTATAALNRMDTALSREEFNDALADYEAIVKQGMARAQGRIDGPTTPAAPQGAPAARYNPATGKIEPVGGN